MFANISIDKLPSERYIHTSQSIPYSDTLLSRKFNQHEISQVYLSQIKLSQKLSAVREEASFPNWDEEEALPVDEKSFHHMQSLISVYPSGLPLPDLYPDPDGTIGMEWEFTDGTNLSVSMMPSGSLAYAILGKNQEGYGKILWDKTVFPKELELLIRSNER